MHGASVNACVLAHATVCVADEHDELKKKKKMKSSRMETRVSRKAPAQDPVATYNVEIGMIECSAVQCSAVVNACVLAHAIVRVADVHDAVVQKKTKKKSSRMETRDARDARKAPAQDPAPTSDVDIGMIE